MRRVLTPANDVLPPERQEQLAPPALHVASRPAGERQLDPAMPRSPKVVKLFLDLVPGQLANLREAARTNDAVEVGSRAHKLKGSCVSIGAKAMGEISAALQHEAQQGNTGDALAQCALLDSLFAVTAEELREELARTSSVAVS
jgi:HPt (histidine-containing phosphotransfer) domain-containing protein